MMRFVESLPQPEWVIFACDQMLQEPDHWCSSAVAITLRKYTAHLMGKALLSAELCWIQRLSVTDRAIASSAPVNISSAIGGDALYVAGDGYNYDTDNRTPFCWKNEWAWTIRKSSGDSFLHQRDPQIFISSMCTQRVLVRRGNLYSDPAGIWRLVNLEGNSCAFYNASQDTFLNSPAEAADGYRRAVITSTFHPLDEQRSEYREWKITAATVSLMEMGLHEFFERKYEKAVQTFSKIMSKDTISFADRKKVVHYRLMANLMLKNEGCAKRDIALLSDLGWYPGYFLSVLYGKLVDKDRERLQQLMENSQSG
ncbi:hypothetical protein GQ600_9708 [Phytophthora cactorum]|nr:hypothetical protein GQ600_9708 [Phytophthora cactorum]